MSGIFPVVILVFMPSMPLRWRHPSPACRRAGLRLPNPVDNVHAFDYLPEDRVLPVEEIVVGKVDEELGAARVGPGICHGDRTAVVPVAGGELVLDRVTGPPLPVPVGSPPWIMKPLMTRWKMVPL